MASEPFADNSAEPLLADRNQVLIVDDEEYVRSILSDVVSKMGLEPVEAADGFEGIDTFTRQHDQIAACVVDLTMPGMSGMELLEKLRAVNPEVSVIIVSGYARHEVKRQEARNEQVCFLRKPFTMESFRDALQDIIQQVN